MARTISKYDDVIDSRDVIARIEELEEERLELANKVDEARDSYDPQSDEGVEAEAVLDAERDLAAWDGSDEAEELRVLRALAAEAESSPDWEYGETLIRSTYFRDYAQELAEDCGLIPGNSQWPCTCIDWEQAANELRSDYVTVAFDGIDYLLRG